MATRRVFAVDIEMKDGAQWIAWSTRNVIAQDVISAVRSAERIERRTFSGKQFPVRAYGVKVLAKL